MTIDRKKEARHYQKEKKIDRTLICPGFFYLNLSGHGQKIGRTMVYPIFVWMKEHQGYQQSYLLRGEI